MDDKEEIELIPLTPPPLVRMPSSPSRSPASQRGKVIAQGVKGRASPKLKAHSSPASYTKTNPAKS